MKTRNLAILIAVIGIIVALIIGVNYESSNDPAFPSDYPLISQNDMFCWTQWYMQSTVIDEKKLISSIRSAISMFGSDFDIPNREITISHNEEETIISIGGSWTKDKANHEKLTAVIKNHIGDSELIRDDIVLCT
ncbi:MAG: hypothetical protein K5790_01460 [Nitrosopumilus sp.]|uniref:hypothetical protein n=1 Tax=Nitrosopumilus sp. TaxID=2024843 RepID=UPI00247C8023|nr:hypothetical protein [Nitrosopumilus sp.]MCV0391941.1 hypothetical protein [Nitrosopumilus sp.]